MILRRSGAAVLTFSSKILLVEDSLRYGVSAIVLPAYLLSIGLGSKLSMWLTPPT